MLTYDEALKLVLQHNLKCGFERIPVAESADRVLAESPTAKVDLPPFLTSSVDGYAVRLPVSRQLKVVAELPAGTSIRPSDLQDGEAVQVFTGSPLPQNSSAVVMIEEVSREAEVITLRRTPFEGENLRPKGEEMTIGQRLIPANEKITPPIKALLIASGNVEVDVFERLKVAIVEIGDELQEPGTHLESGAVYAANGTALQQACEALGAETRLFRSTDSLERLSTTLDEALTYGDVVLTSGGVSVGKHDHVQAVLSRLGVSETFWRVAIRPGKPLFFGAKGDKLVFGLPGNPVSTLVTFYLFVRPVLLLAHEASSPTWQKVRLAENVESASQVDIFLRVKLDGEIARPLKNQASHMLSGLAGADALLRVPRGLGTISVGSTLRALPISWNY